ncbi:MAG: MFS transporter [Anaerolineae bacterium]
MLSEFGKNAAEVGLVDTAQAAGMVAGGVLLGGLAAKLRQKWLIVVGLGALGGMLAGLGLAPTYLVILGVFLTPLESALSALMQTVVPVEAMGRVSGTMNTAQTVAQLISMGVAGAVAQAVGIRSIFVAAGLISVGAAVIAAWAIEKPGTDGCLLY